MSKSVSALVLAVVLMVTGISCQKEDGGESEPEKLLTIDNKLIIGEWKHQQTQLSVFDVTTGAAKSTQGYDLPPIQNLTFTADGKYLFDRTSSGTYGINAAGTLLTFRDAYGTISASDIKTLNGHQLTFSSTEVSENTRLVVVLYFTR